MSRAAAGVFTASCASLVLAVGAAADPGTLKKDPPVEIELGYYSQQIDRGRVRIGASIEVEGDTPGRHTTPASRRPSRSVRLPLKGGATDDLPEPYPGLAMDSTLAQDPQPFGPGSFWYPVGRGRVCIYAPNSVLPCYTLVGPAGAPAGPALDPVAIAAAVADRLPLPPGRISKSPNVTGLAGADSWFWLDPAPRTQEVTVSIVGETVTVMAEPSAVAWRFGDGEELLGGAGRAYRPGPPPEDAIVHTYETRCLPGDQDRNPYVLGSCGSSGYEVEALVAWRISYSATGLVEANGTLPTRTTATSIAYPVSEARGFLVPGTSR
ncbi:MAG: hypothetical protein M3546_04345 [Actinomycetota bacterium]|nr:hypothetical protein [Actinomycetota bacterium]